MKKNCREIAVRKIATKVISQTGKTNAHPALQKIVKGVMTPIRVLNASMGSGKTLAINVKNAVTNVVNVPRMKNNALNATVLEIQSMTVHVQQDISKRTEKLIVIHASLLVYNVKMVTFAKFAMKTST